MKTYLLYHAHCPDGFGAAWAAWTRLGDDARYFPVSFDEPLPTMDEGSRVVIADFSYPKDVLLDLASKMNEVIVLDHHRSAARNLSGLPSLEAVERGESALGVRFDMDKSGAVLAWEFFHPQEAVPELLRYVEDKDLWRFRLDDSRAVSAALSSYPKRFELWQGLRLDELKREGKVLLRLLDRWVKRLVASAYWREVGGYRVPVVNTPMLGSDVGNRLCQTHPEAPFAACYSDHDEHTRHWELRSIGTFDVSEVAQRLGGGGHRNASGFTEKLDPSCALDA